LKAYIHFSEIQNDLKNGTLTCVERVHFHLANIEKKKHLNAFLSVYSEEALSRAAEIDQKIKNGTAGKLAGLIVGLKDVLAYKDHPFRVAAKF
jgi:aspartyl-tRNA(Asn)/glutamyl-tRNA(Gln) amidotransferase subunit A